MIKVKVEYIFIYNSPIIVLRYLLRGIYYDKNKEHIPCTCGKNRRF